MARLVFNVAAALVACSTLCAQAASRELTCVQPIEDAQEHAAIQKNADVVARTGKHELTVKTAGKVLKFQDKAPYGNESKGSYYRFCDRDDGFILLFELDDIISTGVLINETTGLATEAGMSVQFSDDKRAYFATGGEFEWEGRFWKIYAVDGRLSWSGTDSIEKISKGGDHFRVADLSNPAWSPHGEFGADASCYWSGGARTWRARLIKSGGKWDWSPKKDCPDH